MTAAAQPKQPVIQLQNPVQEHFETFIVSNAQQWQTRCAAEMEGAVSDDEYTAILDELGKHRLGAAYLQSPKFHDAVTDFAMRYVARENEAQGQHLVLCGAGPSLRDHAAEYCPSADQVWGCNSALTWLLNEGHRCTHGFTVDQTPHMVAEWASAPEGVEYLIASTVHPNLTQLLWGQDRPLRFFHNFVGIKKPDVQWADANGVTCRLPFEQWLYQGLFPPTLMCGSGLNAVTRALDLARFMGFAKITVLGADSCVRVKEQPKKRLQLGSKQHIRWLKKNTVMHADGGSAVASEASPLTVQGYIDGRFWMTKLDLIISAQWLVRMARASKGRIELVGDTLPAALMDKDEAFLRRLPNFVMPDGTIANIPEFLEGY